MSGLVRIGKCGEGDTLVLTNHVGILVGDPFKYPFFQLIQIYLF